MQLPLLMLHASSCIKRCWHLSDINGNVSVENEMKRNISKVRTHTVPTQEECKDVHRIPRKNKKIMQ